MNLRFRLFESTLAQPWAVSGITQRRGSKTAQSLIVELSDTRVIGLGESAPSARYGESIDTASQFLLKVDPQRLSFDDLAKSVAYVENLAPGHSSAKAALNVALHDGISRKQCQPLHEFLGLGFREGHHLTSFSIGIDRPIVVRKKAMTARDFPILKLKIGGPDDGRNLEALRSVAGNKVVRVDANEAWKSKEEALSKLMWLATDEGIEFVEQPMPAQTPIRDLSWLKERSPLPLFADESYQTAADIRSVLPAFHGVNVKLSKAGGVTGAVEALRTARNAGLKTMLGCMIESSVLISAAAQLTELCDFLDLDGNLLITNDPFEGVTAKAGILSFAQASQKFGIQVSPRNDWLEDHPGQTIWDRPARKPRRASHAS